jgi:DnaJ-class molecular chaperone
VDNHYATLNIAMDAPDAVVRAAYRVLTAQYHPDRAGRGGVRRMQQVNVAYAVLSDPHRRAEHDAALRRQQCRRAGDGASPYGVTSTVRPDGVPEAAPLACRRARVARFYAAHMQPG